MKLEDIALSEICQTQKNKYACLLSFVETKKKLTESRMIITGDWNGAEIKEESGRRVVGYDQCMPLTVCMICHNELH
jgi:inosine/xanthosine triphosphate pyrophosphatase family protein